MILIIFRIVLFLTNLFCLVNLLVRITFMLLNSSWLLWIFILPNNYLLRPGIALLQGLKRQHLIIAKLNYNPVDYLLNQQRSDRHQKILQVILNVILILHVAKSYLKFTFTFCRD
jgi:hypothetical protein